MAKSWYEYTFDITGYPVPPNDDIHGIYNIGLDSASDSFNECLGLVCKWFIEYFQIDPLFHTHVLNPGIGQIDNALKELLEGKRVTTISVDTAKQDPTKLFPYIITDPVDQYVKNYIVTVLNILSNIKIHGNILLIEDFQKVWTFILVRFFEEKDPILYKHENFIFRALKNKLKGIPNMSTFRTQVNPKDGCVASMHAALQRSITNVNDYISNNESLEYTKLSKKITNKKRNRNRNVDAIEREVNAFSNMKNTIYAKACGISPTTLDSATEFEVRFGCYKLMKACGDANPNKTFIDNFYNQCIMSGKKKADGAKLEDEHSLPFKILFGVLKPEAFRVILTRMTHELNHKFIPETYKIQEEGQPLAGQKICNASFTNRLVSQLKENLEYDEYTFCRFLFLFHAYLLANQFVLDSKDVADRFRNLKNVKHLIDLAHTEFHRNVAGGIVKKIEPRHFNQLSLTAQVKQGGSRFPRKSYKKKKIINRTKKMIGGVNMGGVNMVKEYENNDNLHFVIDGNLDNRYSPEYFTLSILSIFDALEMISNSHKVDVEIKYVPHEDGINLFEKFKHDPFLKLLNAIIDLLDIHVDPFFALYHKKVSEVVPTDPYLQARDFIVDKIKTSKPAVVVETHPSYTEKIHKALRDKIEYLKEIIYSIDEMDDIYQELNKLILIIDNPDFMNVLNILVTNFYVGKIAGATKDDIQDVFLNQLFPDIPDIPDSSTAFNVVNYNTFKQRLDAYMYSSTETPVGMNTQTQYAVTVPVSISLPTTPKPRHRRTRHHRRNAFELMPDGKKTRRVKMEHKRNVNRNQKLKMRRGLRKPLGSIGSRNMNELINQRISQQ
uniref:Uncharacterized protein n=1 Tax=viral metagenome TaxID=1070528 RepID=A0A6C0KHR5_9ZZZZ